MTYSENKEKARAEAIDWQMEAGNGTYSYAEVFEMVEHFQKIAKKYGLIKEFRENGII